MDKKKLFKFLKILVYICGFPLMSLLICLSFKPMVNVEYMDAYVSHWIWATLGIWAVFELIRFCINKYAENKKASTKKIANIVIVVVSVLAILLPVSIYGVVQKGNYESVQAQAKKDGVELKDYNKLLGWANLYTKDSSKSSIVDDLNFEINDFMYKYKLDSYYTEKIDSANTEIDKKLNNGVYLGVEDKIKEEINNKENLAVEIEKFKKETNNKNLNIMLSINDLRDMLNQVTNIEDIKNGNNADDLYILVNELVKKVPNFNFLSQYLTKDNLDLLSDLVIDFVTNPNVQINIQSNKEVDPLIKVAISSCRVINISYIQYINKGLEKFPALVASIDDLINMVSKDSFIGDTVNQKLNEKINIITLGDKVVELTEEYNFGYTISQLKTLDMEINQYPPILAYANVRHIAYIFAGIVGLMTLLSIIFANKEKALKEQKA